MATVRSTIRTSKALSVRKVSCHSHKLLALILLAGTLTHRCSTSDLLSLLILGILFHIEYPNWKMLNVHVYSYFSLFFQRYFCLPIPLVSRWVRIRAVTAARAAAAATRRAGRAAGESPGLWISAPPRRRRSRTSWPSPTGEGELAVSNAGVVTLSLFHVHLFRLGIASEICSHLLNQIYILTRSMFYKRHLILDN